MVEPICDDAEAGEFQFVSVSADIIKGPIVSIRIWRTAAASFISREGLSYLPQ